MNKKHHPMTTKQFSVSEYAESKNLTTQAVRWQAKNNKLPTGVTAKKVGSAWIITTSEPI